MTKTTIRSAEVIVTNPGRNFLILKIETEDGVVGYGDGTLNGRELAVASYLSDHIIPILIGMDSAKIEDTWQLLYRGAYWWGGPVTMAALAAVDIALWDIKGKIANMPVYDLLGGKSRESLALYGHASGSSIDEVKYAVQAWKEQGYHHIRAQSAIPGVNSTYGVNTAGGATLGWVPASAELPIMHTWDPEAYIKYIPKLFEELSVEFGDSVKFLHDTHHRLRPIEAAEFTKRMEPFRLFWLEDLCRPERPENFQKVRDASNTPLALGEVFSSLNECRPYFEAHLIDFIRIAAIHAGGITHVRRIIDMAAVYDVRTGLHGPPDVSPVGMAAQVHLGAWAPNFGIQEWAAFPAPEMEEVFQHNHLIESGAVIPSAAPGIGITFDEKAAKKYPYSRSYLGLNRLKDGTAWNY